MTAESDLDRRVSRVENETVHIYDLIDDRTAVLGKRLDEHARILDEHTRILDEHTRILDQHTVSLAEILRRLPEPA